jgi:hypothetical protein
MLRLGMILLGSALVLHGRNKAHGKDDGKDTSPDDDSSANPGGFAPKAYEPVLDRAIDPTNPFLPGPGGDGNPNTAPVPPSIFNPGGGTLGPINNVGATDGGGAAAITANQLSAANNAYKSIINGLPQAAKIHWSVSSDILHKLKRIFHF